MPDATFLCPFDRILHIVPQLMKPIKAHMQKILLAEQIVCP